MPGLEGIIRPFIGQNAAPTPFHPDGVVNAPPVRLTVGAIGGTKTFAWSQSYTLTSYMADVHKEDTSTAFNMATGELAK